MDLFGLSDYKEKNARKLIVEFINFQNDKTYLDSLKEVPFEINTSVEQIQIDYEEYVYDEKRVVTYNFSTLDIQEIIIKQIVEFIYSDIITRLNQSFNVEKEVLKNIFFLDQYIHFKELFPNQTVSINNENESRDTLILLEKIFGKVLYLIQKNRITDEEFYFPASRTGFVLTFDEIVSGVLRERFGGQPTATKLTEPTIDFISSFADIKSGKFGINPFELNLFTHFEIENDKSEKNKIEKLFKFIEKRIIKGELVEERKGEKYTQFYLKPSEEVGKLELHLTSSATVEMLPIVMFLKHFEIIQNKLLIIEEPEAHLHPKAQIEMARFIAILVNSGAKVIITTHSDYIINELSNCIKVSTSDTKYQREYLKKYDLEKNTFIDKNLVSAYLFKDQNKKTKITELEINRYGISNENFDDILDELLDRTHEINENIG